MEDDYLIWSNEHDGWWRQGGPWGYTWEMKSAGRFTREEALKLCKAGVYTAGHIGRISEIPVRVADIIGLLEVDDILKGEKAQ